MNQPLPALSSPFTLLAKLGVSPTAASLGLWLFGIVILFWFLYTLVAIYHWMRYSHASLIALPSIIVHLAVSGVLILFAASGLI